MHTWLAIFHLLPAIAPAAGLAASARPGSVTVAFDPTAPLRSDVPLDYLGINLDTASVAEGMDFASPNFRNIVRQLAPVKLRIGGTASHGLHFTNEPGMPCGCCGSTSQSKPVFLSTDCMDSIGEFLLATNVECPSGL